MITDFAKTLQRQWDIIPLEKLDKTITIIGSGAIGSWTSLALAKMGFLNQTVWDMDKVDIVNLNNQFFPHSSVGQYKVEALKKLVHDFTGFSINIVPDKWTGTPLHDSIVIASVDSMEVRREIFEACGPNTMFIDPRMGAETMHLYIFNPHDDKDVEAYANSWYSDDDATQEACTGRATIYCANILAGLVAKAVKDLACGTTYTRVLRWDLRSSTPQVAGFECWPKANT